MKFEEYNFTAIAEPLQDWFTKNARKLPWREEQTPYHVWLSEIMLQQTRVEAVTGYYNRFLEKLPDIHALAAAPEEEYLKLWEGLGYYSRVRNLHKAAVIIMETYGGVIPQEPDELLRLPGIGSYTAGAIASLAYGKRVPAVDGNVLRVAARLAGDDSDILDASTKKRLENCLQTFYEQTSGAGNNTNTCTDCGDDAANATDPRKINQGLMELGALVCLPNGKPDCLNCPLRAHCQANTLSLTGSLPVRRKLKARRIEDRTVFILEDTNRSALHRRSATGLLAGLWELPNCSGQLSPEEAERYVQELGFTPLRIERLGEAKHVFTHVEWHMTGYRIRIEEEALASPDQLRLREKAGILFVNRSELEGKYTVPSAFSFFRKYLLEI